MNAEHPLITHRKARGLTRRQLAAELDVSVPTVFRWEKRKRLIDDELVGWVSEKTGIPAKELRPDLAEQLLGAAQ